jgi:hypothetical protein
MHSFPNNFFKLPHKFPNKKILSIDIGGTLAKAAFYVPIEEDSKHHNKIKDVLTE